MAWSLASSGDGDGAPRRTAPDDDRGGDGEHGADDREEDADADADA